MKKVISLIRKSKDSIEEEIIARIEINCDGLAKITHPCVYNPEDIINIMNISNSTARKPGGNLSYDEDYTKDERYDPTAIFSMFLNANICERHSSTEVLYCPELTELFPEENSENNSARKKFQKRMSNHIFESAKKIQQAENKPEFIFAPYKIGIYGSDGLQCHELLLVFDTNMAPDMKGYVKYFDSSHFAKAIPDDKIITVFPSPPFPDGFAKNGLINKGEINIFQNQEGSMSCTYWVEAFMLTMLEINNKDIRKVINGSLDEPFKEKLKNKFKELRKTQFKDQQQTIQIPNNISKSSKYSQSQPFLDRQKLRQIPQKPKAKEAEDSRGSYY